MPWSKSIFCTLLYGVFLMVGVCHGQPKLVPEPLQEWKNWATWGEAHPNCPRPFNGATSHICFWPSTLSISASPKQATWRIKVDTFEETWVPLPGNDIVWPLNVLANGKPVPVTQHEKRPAVFLTAGEYQLSGEYRWDTMPQHIAVPEQIGVLALTVNNSPIAIPNWDEHGNVWLRRSATAIADENQLLVEGYRVIADGVPLWLHSDIVLTVSGESREAQLGWVLPEGWILSTVESRLPVAIDDQGRMKVQLRAGKWTVSLHAFRTNDIQEIKFADGATPVAAVELVGFQSQPALRIAEVEGVDAIDVTQTSFPEKWRQLPVYRWPTDSSIRLVQKMRGAGMLRPEGLRLQRRFWLDEDGRGVTYQDAISGRMQQTWRLDAEDDHELGVVRQNGEPQLLTTNPQTGATGVEIRKRDINLEAVGRFNRSQEISAIGWQASVGELNLTLNLPPGWRVFALFGADRVEGDWLTAWSLLDLFLLLVFSLAVFRMMGFRAGLVAFLAFGLAYHEPGAPRFTWLLLLMPIALLRVVPEGTASRWIRIWKYFAVALLTFCLVPFVASQVRNAIFPQLERPGVPYTQRQLFPWESYMYGPSVGARFESSRGQPQEERTPESVDPASEKQNNLSYASDARIQTGPGEPEWTWNVVHCMWDGPVTAEQRVRPFLISRTVHRALAILRLALLLLLAMYLVGVGKFRNPFANRRSIDAVAVSACLALLLLLMLPGTGCAAAAEIPDHETLELLRSRLLEPSAAFPNAAEIPLVQVEIVNDQLRMTCEIHAAVDVAVPLPGKLPAWSPLSVTLDADRDSVVCRRDGYLWVMIPQGVHSVEVAGRLPNTTEWAWTFQLKPRFVEIQADQWDVKGVSRDGVPENQVFFARKQQRPEQDAEYDQKNYAVAVGVDRRIEAGHAWKVTNTVTRFSAPGKPVSIQVPLMPGERVLSSHVDVENGHAEVRLSANDKSASWQSELPVGENIRLFAPDTTQWTERWYLVTSAKWNTTLAGLPPIFETDQQELIPVWHPWPGEEATLEFRQPKAIAGETMTIQHVQHTTDLGSRQRTSRLQTDVVTSLGDDLDIQLPASVEIVTLAVDGRKIPIRFQDDRLLVPVRPGRQTVDVTWRADEKLGMTARSATVVLPVEAANVVSIVHVPENRWVLWAQGPLRGPAVMFWTILVTAVLAALVLGSLPLSPLRRIEWVLLAIGLTQVHLMAATVVVFWLFLVAWRGRQNPVDVSKWLFILLQLLLVPLTFAVLVILVVVVAQGLLGNPDMFILGNGSTRTNLQWFQPRSIATLPTPVVFTISVWFYRLLMLFWALWLASALLRWLKFAWTAYSNGGCWVPRSQPNQPSDVIAATPVIDT